MHVEQGGMAIKELGWWVLACGRVRRGRESCEQGCPEGLRSSSMKPCGHMLLLLWQNFFPFMEWRYQ